MTPARAKARLKQIAFGYNTVGYSRYIFLVPKDSRGRDMGHYPRTPDPYQNCSKRSFDGQIKKWRRLLHAYDPREDFEELRKGRLRQKTVRAGSPHLPNTCRRTKTHRFIEHGPLTPHEENTRRAGFARSFPLDRRRGRIPSCLGDWDFQEGNLVIGHPSRQPPHEILPRTPKKTNTSRTHIQRSIVKTTN